MEAVLSVRDARRAELGDLLRSRRQKLSVERAGLPARSRRRTPGLRREEVAELAGISVALYAWLEQGRDVPVSHRTIDAIAGALQLSSGEIAHLHRLLSREPVDAREDLTPNLRRFVHSLRSPAFVLDGRWDFILRNAEAAAVFGGSTDLEERRNLLVEIFTAPETAALFSDYTHVAEHVVAMFRLDYASHIDDARTQELVERLRATVPAFDTAWQQHGVSEHPEGIREIIHPIAGTLRLAPALYGVAESPGLRIMVFTATDEVTESRVASLTKASAIPRCASVQHGVGKSTIEPRQRFAVFDRPVRQQSS
jgi:transcriptional regulator with XRE-family HTH domain